MRPEPQYFHHLLGFQDLVNDSMLDIDAPRISAGKISNQLFVGWWILVWILPDNPK